MAFSFVSVASGGKDAGQEAVQVHDGPELSEIQTDQLGFTGVHGEVKLRLLPESWPDDGLPIPSASLLSVASSQGLVAAASPSALVVVTTDGVRSALSGDAKDNISNIDPLLTIRHSRLAHIAFSADESVLVVSEEEQGGIIAYQVDQLKARRAQPALQLDTSNIGLRALVPNPVVQTAYLFACITTQGDLVLADLEKGQLVEGPQGVALAANVTSLSWSNKGKQLVAGCEDGTALQLKPDGTIVGRIPKSTSIPENVHISAISWLENDVFFAIYTPNTTDLRDGIPPSDYYIITRNKSQFEFQKLPEILPAFGVERVPTHHFITRLRDWKPCLTDLMLLSSTTATEIGILSKSTQSLSTSEQVTNTFAFTTTDDDTRRASLPLSHGTNDTSPIGMALDLSAKSRVVNPIPKDPEIEETAGPVPNILILNNEGILCSWWIIYNDSVRQKTTFSGFSTLSTMDQARAAASPPPPAHPVSNVAPSVASSQLSPQLSDSSSAFQRPSTLDASPFTKPSATFGQTPSQPAFGAATAFGSVSKIGGGTSSWTSTGFGSTSNQVSNGSSAFGQSAFGQPSFGSNSMVGSGSAFGSANATGQKAPEFGQSGFGSQSSTTAFGNTSSASPFGAATASGNSGFSAFASNGGFAAKAVETQQGDNASPFGKAATSNAFGAKPSSESPFSQPTTGNSTFGQKLGETPFAKGSPFSSTVQQTGKSVFGSATPFKLASSFKSDGTAKDDLPKPLGGSGFGFGTGFNDLLGNSQQAQLSPTHDKEEEMDDESVDGSASSVEKNGSRFSGPSQVPQQPEGNLPKTFVTPPATISQTKVTPAPPLSNLFGSGNENTETPKASGIGFSWGFGNATSTTPKETPAATKSIFGAPQTEKVHSAVTPSASAPSDAKSNLQTPVASKSGKDSMSRIATESPPSDADAVNIKHIPDPPLSPERTTKPDLQKGNISKPSINPSKLDDAPLPPDFLPANKSAVITGKLPPFPDNARGIDEDDDEEFSSSLAGTEEDVTQDVSPGDNGDDEDVEEEDDDDDEDDEDDETEHVQTSPESSFKGDNTTNSIASPTGGLFTNVSLTQQSKPSRPLFGEIGTTAPIFAPPKPQESPRSPSPVRQLLPHDTLRSDSRSVSAPAPARQRSAIDQRKLDYAQSGNAAKAAQARQEETAREKARMDASFQAQKLARNKQLQTLEDDEDQRIQRELALPIQPTDSLDAFITYEPAAQSETGKVDIPAQIERLYQDINSMVYTLGINARSLVSFVAYQKGQSENQIWPAILRSETPLDTMNDEWYLQDIERLYEGCTTLEAVLEDSSVDRVAEKLELCQTLLTRDLSDLRTKVTALRKSFSARQRGDATIIPLSAEQASIQHDLRRSASSVQTKLISVEDSLSILRARISGLESSQTLSSRQSVMGSSSKKPTVEAVVNTVAKMTSMAEKRSADVDVLESQLKRLGIRTAALGAGEANVPKTPPRSKSGTLHTPGSGVSSVFYTPESQTAGSARSFRALTGSARRINGSIVMSADDRQVWRTKERRKKDVATALRDVLRQKQNQTSPMRNGI